VADPAIKALRRQRFRELDRANARALAGAGVPESDVLEVLNRWHLGVLGQKLAGGALMLHLGLARPGRGAPLCTAGDPRDPKQRIWAPEQLGAFRSPYFSIRLPEPQRWWCGIVWLEQNRGCQECVHRAYKWADDEGWAQPRALGDQLGLGEGLGPERGSGASGPRITSTGFRRG
jgi:hypothetical protein